MPRVRSRKRTNYNFLTRRSDKEPENLQINSSENESIDVDDNILIEFLPPNKVLTPHSRSAKVRCYQKMSDVINSELTHNSQVLRERTRVRRATESCERRAQRLERLRQRASQRIASESSQQREQRLEKQRCRNARRYRALEENKINCNSNLSLDQGTVFKQVKICKLCLILIKDEHFKIIEGSTRDVFEFLFSNPSLDGDNQIICNDCSVKLFEAYNFKAMCLEIEDTISPYVNTPAIEQFDLGEIFSKEKGYKDAQVVPEGHKVCRLCMQLIEHDVVPLREVDREMIREFIPDMNLGVTIDLIICEKCHGSLFAYRNFVKSCLNVTAQGRLHANNESVIDTHTMDPYIKTEDMYNKCETEYEKEGEPYETELFNIKSEQIKHESDTTAEDEINDRRH